MSPAEKKKISALFKRDGLHFVAWNLLLLALGSLIYVIGVNGILTPHRFASGGVLGVALVMHYLAPGLGVGLAYGLLNLPLVLLGWFRVSRRFILYTACGTLAFALWAEFLKVPPIPVKDPILAAILAGVICGAGGGIMLRSAGSAGGLDILSVYLHQRFGLRVGITGVAASALVLLLAAVVLDLQTALYALIFVFTTGKVMDQVLIGFSRRKSVLIVSDHSDDVARAIMQRYQRGLTYLEGAGGYSGKPKKVILSIVALMDLAQFKRTVLEVDPEAFIIINDTLEVLGTRHGKMRSY